MTQKIIALKPRQLEVVRGLQTELSAVAARFDELMKRRSELFAVIAEAHDVALETVTFDLEHGVLVVQVAEQETEQDTKDVVTDEVMGPE